MDISTKDGEVVFFDVNALQERLNRVPDPREAKGKRYELGLVLILVILAKLSGEDRPWGIAEWVRLRSENLIRMLGVRRPSLPCHNTYRRVLTQLDNDALQVEFSNYLLEQRERGESVLIALDGKTLRGTIPQGCTQGVHLLAAYLPAEGIVLMQVAVESKENEISAAPKLLEHLDLRGKVVRGDALLTQRKLSTQIVAAGGNYLWVVKGNQEQLLADIEEVFQPAPTAAGWHQVPRDLRTAQVTHHGHGRLETRTLTASTFLNDFLDWPKVKQVFCLQRRSVQLTTGAIQTQTTYGLTSLSPEQASPCRLLTLMRDYWGIENGLHYRRDRTLLEDATRVTIPGLAQAIATINNFIIGLMYQFGFRNLPSARRHFAVGIESALAMCARY